MLKIGLQLFKVCQYTMSATYLKFIVIGLNMTDHSAFRI